MIPITMVLHILSVSLCNVWFWILEVSQEEQFLLNFLSFTNASQLSVIIM